MLPFVLRRIMDVVLEWRGRSFVTRFGFIIENGPWNPRLTT